MVSDIPKNRGIPFFLVAAKEIFQWDFALSFQLGDNKLLDWNGLMKASVASWKVPSAVISWKSTFVPLQPPPFSRIEYYFLKFKSSKVLALSTIDFKFPDLHLTA